MLELLRRKDLEAYSSDEELPLFSATALDDYRVRLKGLGIAMPEDSYTHVQPVQFGPFLDAMLEFAGNLMSRRYCSSE